MKKAIVALLLVVMTMVALSGLASAEHRDIGGIGVRSQPGVWIMFEHGGIGGI